MAEARHGSNVSREIADGQSLSAELYGSQSVARAAVYGVLAYRASQRNELQRF